MTRVLVEIAIDLGLIIIIPCLIFMALQVLIFIISAICYPFLKSIKEARIKKSKQKRDAALKQEMATLDNMLDQYEREHGRKRTSHTPEA